MSQKIIRKKASSYIYKLMASGKMQITDQDSKVVTVGFSQVQKLLLDPDLNATLRKKYEGALSAFPTERDGQPC